MMIDPREFRRAYPFFQMGIVFLTSVLAASSHTDLALCIAVCACVTETIRAGWSTILEPTAPFVRGLTLLAVLTGSAFLLAAALRAIHGDLSTAALSLLAAILLRGMGPVRVSAGSARA